MSERGFTPGPWVPSKFGFQVLTGDSWSTICSLKNGAKWEDGRPDYLPEYDWQLQEANARLIAAAPDLYEVVQELVAAMHCYEGWADVDAPIEHLEMMARAYAAIAKADGPAAAQRDKDRQP